MQTIDTNMKDVIRQARLERVGAAACRETNDEELYHSMPGSAKTTSQV